MHDVERKSVTQTADRIVTREVRGEETDLIRVPISSTAMDRDGDRFAVEALEGMRDQIKREQPKVFQNHGFTAFNKPLYDDRETIGTQVDAEVERGKDDDEDATLFSLILPDKTHPEGERMKEQIDAGHAEKFSVGFRVKEAKPIDPEDENNDGRIFLSADQMETSKVGIPSNPEASASVAAKAADLTAKLEASGMDIDDEVAFAKALAAELVSEGEGEPTEDFTRREVLEGATKSTKVEGGCEEDSDCPDGEVCRDGECVDEDDVEDLDTEPDEFTMDDDAKERFEALEERLDTLIMTIDEQAEDPSNDEGKEAEQSSDDDDAEQDGATTPDPERLSELEKELEKLKEGDFSPTAPETDLQPPTTDATDEVEGSSDGGKSVEDYI